MDTTPNKRDLGIDIAILVVVLVAFGVVYNGDLARAAGAWLGTLLIGWALFEYPGRKFKLQKTRRAAVGLALLSIIFLPLEHNHQAEARATDTVLEQNGPALGQYMMACRAIEHLAATHCPGLDRTTAGCNAWQASVKPEFAATIANIDRSSTLQAAASKTLAELNVKFNAQDIDKPASCVAMGQFLANGAAAARQSASAVFR